MDNEKEIPILYDFPVVLTKDKDWMRRSKPMMKPGAVIILPDDAVLIMPPILQSIDTKVEFEEAKQEEQPQ